MQFKSLALLALASLQLTTAATIYSRDEKYDPTVTVTREEDERFKYEIVFESGKLPKDTKGSLQLRFGLSDRGTEGADLDRSSGVATSDNLEQTSAKIEFYQGHVNATWEYNGDYESVTLTAHGGGVGNKPLGEDLKFELEGSFTPEGGDAIIEYKDITNEL